VESWWLMMVMPQNLLEKSIDKQVSIKLKDGRIMEGKLVGYDEYMNMVLEGTEEETKEEKRRLGTVILRGNNVVSITPK
jgi:small nuclear ribonucleoprotein